MSELMLYKIDPMYLKYMHKIDYRVSLKHNNRPFVGIITMINGIKYVLPLTSQTTQERKEKGKSKRSSLITTFVRDENGIEISSILHNNMFPVKDGVYTKIDINPSINIYETLEIRYIRKNSQSIIEKAHRTYVNRINKKNPFFSKACCDFEKLEKHYLDYDGNQSVEIMEK